ncbi:hypothetical protein [Bacillus sp. FJAT-45350]|uniref:hypothetical protein n=1 Tax=Bacillus sp. FJAT-45350 TaxID=2011014 RepID=UPI000BB83C11|nr:hypothetical protein [Bacillus sp. FJAT-45350]
MYRKGYHRLFWGLLLVFLSFRLNGLDILPDFIGYMMVVSSLGLLVSQNEIFGKARPFAYILVFISIFSIYEAQGGAVEGVTVTVASTFILVVYTIENVLKLFMVYYIIKAIYEMAKGNGLHELLTRTTFTWNIYLVVNVILLLIQPFLISVQMHLAAFLVIVMLITFFVVEIMLLVTIKRAGDMLNDKQGEEADLH